jgi:hypothetical protein
MDHDIALPSFPDCNAGFVRAKCLRAFICSFVVIIQRLQRMHLFKKPLGPPSTISGGSTLISSIDWFTASCIYQDMMVYASICGFCCQDCVFAQIYLKRRQPLLKLSLRLCVILRMVLRFLANLAHY